MASKRTSFITPEKMTVYMSKMLSRDLKNYAGYCNAILCTIDYVHGPVWAMQLYNGKVVHWAILEELGRVIYVYAGPLHPNPIFPQGQFYERTVPTKKGLVIQKGYIEQNNRLEACIRWISE